MNHPIPTLRRAPRSRSAFTLIELLLVLVILAILAAIVVPKLTGRSEQARKARAQQDIANIGNSLAMFEQDQGRFPTTDEGLAALITPPANVKDTTHFPYIERNGVPNDPWNNPYQYRSPGTQSKTGYDLFSMGPDGHEGGNDDIDNWSPR